MALTLPVTSCFPTFRLSLFEPFLQFLHGVFLCSLSRHLMFSGGVRSFREMQHAYFAVSTLLTHMSNCQGRFDEEALIMKLTFSYFVHAFYAKKLIFFQVVG